MHIYSLELLRMYFLKVWQRELQATEQTKGDKM